PQCGFLKASVQKFELLRIRNFVSRVGIDHIKGVDGRAFLRADARERDVNSFSAKTGQQIVEKPEAIGRLHLHQRISRMRLVIDSDACREIESLTESMIGAPTRLLQ